MEEKNIVVISDTQLVACAIILGGLLLFGHDVMKNGYSMKIINNTFSCVIAPAIT